MVLTETSVKTLTIPIVKQVPGIVKGKITENPLLAQMDAIKFDKQLKDIPHETYVETFLTIDPETRSIGVGFQAKAYNPESLEKAARAEAGIPSNQQLKDQSASKLSVYFTTRRRTPLKVA